MGKTLEDLGVNRREDKKSGVIYTIVPNGNFLNTLDRKEEYVSDVVEGICAADFLPRRNKRREDIIINIITNSDDSTSCYKEKMRDLAHNLYNRNLGKAEVSGQNSTLFSGISLFSVITVMGCAYSMWLLKGDIKALSDSFLSQIGLAGALSILNSAYESIKAAKYREMAKCYNRMYQALCLKNSFEDK